MQFFFMFLIFFSIFEIKASEVEGDYEGVKFSLVAGSLKDNLEKMFSYESHYRLLWQVSERHQVIVDADVKARDIYHLTDQIISAYTSPKQIKAQFYTKNNVVRIYYADR